MPRPWSGSERSLRGPLALTRALRTPGSGTAAIAAIRVPRPWRSGLLLGTRPPLRPRGFLAWRRERTDADRLPARAASDLRPVQTLPEGYVEAVRLDADGGH